MAVVSVLKTSGYEWTLRIGLEIHAQVACATKLFSDAPVNFRASVNSAVAYFDTALPGTMPVLNKKCVEAGVLTALALNCQVNMVSVFDRKHYFYADLPAGYQITQQRVPLAVNGFLDYFVPVLTSPEDSETLQTPLAAKTTKIEQLQLEQDSGKSINDEKNSRTLVDFNRAGVALMELVTEPNLMNASEAVFFLRELRFRLRELGTCHGILTEGQMRCDVNVSVARQNEPHTVRVEVKNLNNVGDVRSAINYEFMRQKGLLEAGLPVAAETRSLVSKDDGEITVAMRDKGLVMDYRIMSEPNLPPLRLFDSLHPPPPNFQDDQVVDVDVIRLGLNRKTRIDERQQWIDHNMPIASALVFSYDNEMYEWLTQGLQIGGSPTDLCEFWMKFYWRALMESNCKLRNTTVTMDDCFFLIQKLAEKEISDKAVERVLNSKLNLGVQNTAKEIIEADRLFLINDTTKLDLVCSVAIDENAELLKRYKAKNPFVRERVLQSLVQCASDKCGNRIGSEALKAMLISKLGDS